MVEDIPCERGFVHSDLGERLFIEGQTDERGNLEIMEGLIFSKRKQLKLIMRRQLYENVNRLYQKENSRRHICQKKFEFLSLKSKIIKVQND